MLQRLNKYIWCCVSAFCWIKWYLVIIASCLLVKILLYLGLCKSLTSPFILRITIFFFPYWSNIFLKVLYNALINLQAVLYLLCLLILYIVLVFHSLQTLTFAPFSTVLPGPLTIFLRKKLSNVAFKLAEINHTLFICAERIVLEFILSERFNYLIWLRTLLGLATLRSKLFIVKRLRMFHFTISDTSHILF